jgi:hypothetical protein
MRFGEILNIHMTKSKTHLNEHIVFGRSSKNNPVAYSTPDVLKGHEDIAQKIITALENNSDFLRLIGSYGVSSRDRQWQETWQAIRQHLEGTLSTEEAAYTFDPETWARISNYRWSRVNSNSADVDAGNLQNDKAPFNKFDMHFNEFMKHYNTDMPSYQQAGIQSQHNFGKTHNSAKHNLYKDQ